MFIPPASTDANIDLPLPSGPFPVLEMTSPPSLSVELPAMRLALPPACEELPAVIVMRPGVLAASSMFIAIFPLLSLIVEPIETARSPDSATFDADAISIPPDLSVLSPVRNIILPDSAEAAVSKMMFAC